MKLFDVNLKKQRAILLEVTPEINSILEVLEWIDKTRSGGEKAKAAKSARFAAVIAAETAKDAKSIAAAKQLRLDAANAMSEAEAEASERGISMIKDIIDILLNKQYEGILKIIALLHGTTPEKLEEEKSIFDLVDMIFDTLSSEKLTRFFPQLRRLALVRQSGTSQS